MLTSVLLEIAKVIYRLILNVKTDGAVLVFDFVGMSEEGARLREETPC